MSDSIITSFKRYEVKYFLTPAQKEALMPVLLRHFAVDEYGETTISNVFYDTDSYEIIRASIEQPIYKEKLRIRAYGTPDRETGTVFVELKKKYDGVVYKRRIFMNPSEVEPFLSFGIIPAGADPQIAAELLHFMAVHHNPRPKVYLCYDRTAFFGLEDSSLRITMDRNLRWRDDNVDLCTPPSGGLIIPADTTLMEIKIPGVMPLWLSHTLSELGIFRSSFSKIGSCYKQFIIPRQFPINSNQESVVKESCSRVLFPQVSPRPAFSSAHLQL